MIKETKIKIGKQIKQLRIKLDLNQENFGKVLGVTKAYISQVEKGQTELTKEKLNILKEKYKFTPTLQNKANDISLIDQIKLDYSLSSEDTEFINTLLSNKTKRKMATLFFDALEGNNDASDIIKMIICSPTLKNEFSDKNPTGILKIGKAKEDAEYIASIEEAKKQN